MTEISPDAAATPEADALPPDPGSGKENRSRTSRAMRNPLVRVASAVAGIALGWGAVHVATNLWASRNDNTPISSSSQRPGGTLRVSGHGVTLTLPHGWVNVPTTPDKLAQFIRARAAQFPHLRAALKSELESVQNLRNVAVVAYRADVGGPVTATLYVYVAPAAIPPSVLKPHVKGFVAQVGGTLQRDSLTTFGKFPGLLVTYTLPGQAGGRANYAAVAFVHGASSTPVITVKTFNAADSIATLRRIVDTIQFS